MNTLTIPLKDGEYELLADLARFLGEGAPEAMVKRSVDRLLNEERARLALIEQAHRSADRGALTDDDEVWAKLEDRIEARRRVMATAAE